MRPGWVSAHQLLEDETRWDDPAFDLWHWIRAGWSWTPEVDVPRAVRRIRLKDAALGAFVGAILEISDESPIIRALNSGGYDAIYDLVGCTELEARAHALSLYRDVTYSDVADVLGCKPNTAETYVRRAQGKLASLRPTLAA
jgi:DNA-binding CsgD family transcriptional regulator